METYGENQPVVSTVQCYPALATFQNVPINQPIPDTQQIQGSSNSVNLTGSVN